MGNARSIVKRLKAVRNIRKITRTMELIATARFKKAMDRATEAAVYTRKISEIVGDLARANLSFSHPLLQPRAEIKTSVILLITSNRGYCGGYNGAVMRQAFRRYEEAQKKCQKVVWDVAGKRGVNYLKYAGIEAQHKYLNFEDRPMFEEIEPIAQRCIEGYIKGDIDQVDVIFTEFKSVSKQIAKLETLLPLSNMSVQATPNPKAGSTAQQESKSTIDYEFLPSAESILQEIVPAAFKAKVFKCFLDAAVSEQIARMVAMKGATENADEMIGVLKQSYNRARQSQITSELAEIIGGAAALE